MIIAAGAAMAKTRIKISRADDGNVYRSLVLIDDRVLPFQNSDEINIFVKADVEHGITIYCEGPRGANTTAKVQRAEGKVIDPLTATVDNDYGVSHASDVFTVSAA